MKRFKIFQILSLYRGVQLRSLYTNYEWKYFEGNIFGIKSCKYNLKQKPYMHFYSFIFDIFDF